MPLTQVELPEHSRFTYKDPRKSILGRCECGCRDQIEVGYEHIIWDDMYFSDASHVIAYLKKTDGLREVS